MIRLSKPIEDGRILVATHHGDANFVITTVNAHGEEIDLIVNTIGSYTGTRLIGLDDDPIAALKVTADGSWTIRIADIRKATQWDVDKPISGRGDQVLIIPGGTSGMRTMSLTDTGESNFVVYSVSDSRELLVNEIGPWSGTEILPEGTVALDIESGGKWTIKSTG